MPKSITFDRDQVMSNVMKLFWEKGYNGTSMQDLVNVTGLNRSSFYNSFGDKFSLYEEALSLYQSQQMENLHQVLHPDQSPKEALVSLFKGISSDIAKGNKQGCMLSKCTSELSAQEPRVMPFLKENKDRVVKLFATLIRKGQDEDEISRDKDPDTLALYLFVNLQGLKLTSMLETDLQQVTKQILKVL